MKMGDKVLVKYATFSGTDESVGKTFLVTGINKRGMVWLNDRFPPAQWSPHRPEALEVVPGNCIGFSTGPTQHETKQAAIKVRHLDVKDVPCVEILGFRNILTIEELPKEYCEKYPYFVRYTSMPIFARRFNGVNFDTNCAAEKRDSINLEFPSTPPIIDLMGCASVLRVGDIIPATTFDAIMVWLKWAGHRLAKINRKNREAMKQEGCLEIKGNHSVLKGVYELISGIGFTEAEAKSLHKMIDARTREEAKKQKPKEEWVTI